MSERLYFDAEHPDDLDQSFDLHFESLNIRLQGSVRLVPRNADGGDFLVGASQDILDPLDRIVRSMRRHRQERNRSRSDDQGAG